MLAVYAGLLILIAAVIGAASQSWLTSRSDDRLAVIGNLLSLGTLLLALVAGIVALATYSAATGLPDLKLQFKLPRVGLQHGCHEGRTPAQRPCARAHVVVTTYVVLANLDSSNAAVCAFREGGQCSATCPMGYHTT